MLLVCTGGGIGAWYRRGGDVDLSTAHIDLPRLVDGNAWRWPAPVVLERPQRAKEQSVEAVGHLRCLLHPRRHLHSRRRYVRAGERRGCGMVRLVRESVHGRNRCIRHRIRYSGPCGIETWQEVGDAPECRVHQCQQFGRRPLVPPSWVTRAVADLKQERHQAF